MLELRGEISSRVSFYFAMGRLLNARHKLPEAQWCYEEAIPAECPNCSGRKPNWG
jgi:hypothetical protein